MLTLLALCHSFGFLCSFASLHACLHVHACVCVSSILQSHGTMDTWSKPTFVLLGHPILFDKMFVCPCWFSLIVCLLAWFPSSCLFASVLACFLCHCMYTLGVWTLRARVRPARCKKKGQGCKQEDAMYLSSLLLVKRARVRPPQVVTSFFLSLSLFSRAMY